MNTTSDWKSRLRWGGFFAAWVVAGFICLRDLLTGRVPVSGSFIDQAFSRWAGHEAAWIGAYLVRGAGAVIGFSILFMFVSRRSISCASIFVVLAAVYLVQVGNYVYSKGFNWWLLAPLLLPATLGSWIGARKLYEKLRPTRCCKCGGLGQYVFSSETPGSRGKRDSYCFEHFKVAVRNSLRRRKSWFLIAERPVNGGKEGSYFFYAPEDLLQDSYPQSDVDAVNVALDRVFGADWGKPVDLRAVRIPSRAMREPRLGADGPLLKITPESTQASIIGIEELLDYLRTAAADFNASGRSFSMNKPYANRGIYVWHDYV